MFAALSRRRWVSRDRTVDGGLPCQRHQMGARVRGSNRSSAPTVWWWGERHGVGRNVAFCKKKSNKCWVWLAYDRDAARVHAVELGRRDTQTCRGLWQQLELFDIEHVCSDHYPARAQVVPPEMHVVSKAETCAIEGLNSRIRHYLARFRRPKPFVIPKRCIW